MPDSTVDPSVRSAVIVLGLAVAGIVAMGVMLLTGYMPSARHVHHAVVYAVVAGFTSGLLIAFCLVSLGTEES